MTSEFLSTNKAAELLGVGTTSIKRWADEGRLQCIKTAGGHRRFRRSEVLSMMEEPPADTANRPLSSLSHAEQEALDYGLIGFRDDMKVVVYNRWEQEFAGISETDALGRDIFTELVPCASNDLVAGRFEEARRDSVDLNYRLDYVFTYRMKPTRVTLTLRRKQATGMNWLVVSEPQVLG